MQAVNNIEKGELMELRSMKTPSELAVQVLEAVCVLLGVKADWNAAKMLMADSQFIQKLLPSVLRIHGFNLARENCL